MFLSLSLCFVHCYLSFSRSSSAMVLSICFRLMNMNVPLVMFATLLQTYVLVLFVISNFGEFGLKQLNKCLLLVFTGKHKDYDKHSVFTCKLGK